MRKRIRNEDGQIAAKTLMIAGFAAVALLAVMWIGNTAAGLSGDTATCISKVGRGATITADNVCRDDSDRALQANYSRENGVGFIADFGATRTIAGEESTALRVGQARVNLERGLERFGGEKYTVYADSTPFLNAISSATTKAQILTALQKLQFTITEARDSGETTTSGQTIRVGADILIEIDHPAATDADTGQKQAQLGNQTLSGALSKVNYSINNISTLSLSELKTRASEIGTDINTTNTLYVASLANLNKAITTIAK